MEQYADGPAPLTLSADAQAKLQQASPSPAAEPARRPAVNPEQPPPAPAIAIPAVVSQPATRIPDADFARVKPGLAYSELFALLGKPYSRVEGDSLHLTYRLESGKIGRVLVENRAVTSVRITE
jgi:hypothetical protein